MYNTGVELVFYRNHLVDISISELINLFDYAEKIVNKPIDIYTVTEVAKNMLKLDLAPSKIDIGRITNEYLNQKKQVFIVHQKFREDWLTNYRSALQKHL